jgi:hypothetical protein
MDTLIFSVTAVGMSAQKCNAALIYARLKRISVKKVLAKRL